MIITLKGADFSNSNVGTLNTWLINKSLKGVTTTSTVTSVDKDGSYTATFKVTDGYELYSEYVTMGGVDITEQLIWSSDTEATLTIEKVTGNVYINIVANSTSGEEEEPDTGGDDAGANTKTYVYKEEEWTIGFINASGNNAQPSSASHGYITIPAENVYSITVVPQQVGAVGGLYYLVHIDGTGKSTTYWDIKDGITAGIENTQVFNGEATGTFYLNCFDVQKNSTAVYVTEAVITYM